jgi:hypothetical protein
VRETFFSPVLGSVTQADTVSSEMLARLAVRIRDFFIGSSSFSGGS